MALRYLRLSPCGSEGKIINICVEDTSTPPLIIGNVYAFSGITNFNEFRAGCYLIAGQNDKTCSTPEAVAFSPAFTPEQCEDCQLSIAKAIQMISCSFGDTVYIPIDSISPTPTIGDVFDITVAYDNNKGGIFYLTGCYSVNSFPFVPPDKFSVISPVVSYSAQTDCETCISNSAILYTVRECLSGNEYVISFPNNIFEKRLITFTGLDGITQYCGVVGDLAGLPAIITGLLVSDLGVFDEESGNDCNLCLETVADKRKMVNCLTGEELIVWASSLFTVGDATNLSYDNGCWFVSSDPVDPSTRVDITELANFDPHSNCEDCLECHGATYYYSSCTEVEICGGQNLIQHSNIGLVAGRDFVIDSNDFAFVPFNSLGIIGKFNLLTQSYDSQSVNFGGCPMSLSINEGNGIICVSNSCSNIVTFINYNNLSQQSTIFVPQFGGLKSYFDPIDNLFYVAFGDCCAHPGIRVYSGTSYNSMTQVANFGNLNYGYGDIVRIGSKIYASNLNTPSIDVFSIPSYTLDGSISIGVDVRSFDYDNINTLYLGANTNYYTKLDIPSSGLTNVNYVRNCSNQVNSIKVNNSTDKIYITDSGCNIIYEFQKSTDILLKTYNNLGNDGIYQMYGIAIDSSNNTWFSSYYSLFQVGCTQEFITGEINSYEYIPIGNTFYDPIKNTCLEVTSIDTSFDGDWDYYSLVSYSGCPECTGQTFDLFYCTECSDGLYDGLLVAPAGQYSIGDFVKSHWGNSNWFCFEISDIWTENDYGIPQVIFDAEGDISYSSCTDCAGSGTVGITVVNCDTLVESQVTVTFEQWSQIEGVFTFPYSVISDTNGNCYTVVNSCPIDNIYPSFPLGDFYINSTQCRTNQTQNLPRSAGTESTICVICYDVLSGETATSVSPPHPVWTDSRGIAVTQLNAIALGGMNGLNN